MAHKYVKTEGIILSSKPYLEGDSILRILSPQLGLVSAVARGARKTTSKRAGVLQPFNRALFELYEGKSMYTVVQVKMEEPHAQLSANYEKAIAAVFACEIIVKTHEENQKIDYVFPLLLSFLEVLEKSNEAAGFVYLGGFLLAYFKLLGYRFPLEKCKGCNRKITETAEVSLANDGQVFCKDCSESQSELLNTKTVLAAAKAAYILEARAKIPPSYPFASKLENVSSVKKEEIKRLLIKIVEFLKYQTAVEPLSLEAVLDAIERMK